MYYLKRSKQLGLHGITRVFGHRYLKWSFAQRHRQRAQERQAHNTWDLITRRHLLSLDFSCFWKIMVQRSSIIGIDVFFDTIAHEMVIIKADQASQFIFDILGSGPVVLDPKNKNMWQQDFRLKTVPLRQASFDRLRMSGGERDGWGYNTFYQDIIIPSGKTNDFDIIGADIKIPWELSRLQHLSLFGQAYQISKKNNDLEGMQRYIHAFQEHVTHWLDHNPFLLGVNWVCPMEVAIRAINLVSGFGYFADELLISELFWERFVCSLYDHADYLKNNWEWSDKPNNHYLADLLGYLYLCFFFSEIPFFAYQQKIIIRRLLAQFKQQINPDGTSYEGSTAYHRLDTEMMEHLVKLCNFNQIKLPEWFYETYNRAVTFLNDCTDNAGNFVIIGDDDSGKIVCGVPFETPFGLLRVSGKNLSPLVLSLSKDTSNNPQPDILKTYPNFGLTIIKKAGWHITFRQQILNQRQPTGHFHQDNFSITLSIDGIPILVDPGSYLYTANAAWRNRFRSFESHNTFYQYENNRQNLEKSDLFQLSQEAQITHARQLTCNQEQEELVLEDCSGQDAWDTFVWRFIFHPNIKLVQKNVTSWLIFHEEKNIAILESMLIFEKISWYYAPSYGVCMKTDALTSTTSVSINQIIKTIIKRV